MRGNDRACLIPQSRSGCSSPKVPAPRPGRRSRFSGLSGHHVEICDPSPWCLSRFSRFVRKFHRCPGLRDDPVRVSRLHRAAARHADNSTCCCRSHEQGFLFARVRQRLAGRVGLALPDFESYRTAHSKAGFSRLLDRLGLPQPPTRIVTSAQGIARRRPVSCRRQDLGRHRQPRHLVRARCRRSRNCVARSRGKRRIR